MNWAKAIVGVVFVLWSSTAWGATLTWTPNKETDVGGYRIYHCSQLPCTRTSGHESLLVILGKTTSFNIGTPAVTQYYFITAYDFAHHESGDSNVATFTPGTPGASMPPLPPHLVWSSGSTLAWTASNDRDLAGYRIYHCSQLPCTHASSNESLLVTLGKTTSFHIGTPAVTQYYFITAYDFAHHESGDSNGVTFTPNAPPLPPHLVLVSGPTLAWTASNDRDLAGYRIYHCSQLPCTHASSNESLLVTLGKTTSFHIGTPAVTQYYFITAYDFAHHESGDSNGVTFTPNAPPLPPHLVLVSGPTLAWTASNDRDLAGYRIYHCSQLPCTHASSNESLLVTLGKTTSFHIGTPAVTQYYFITAYDFAHHESGDSNGVTFTPGG